jgi:hypothetical protein
MAHVRTDVSEERIASIIRVKNQRVRNKATSSNRSTLRSWGLVLSQLMNMNVITSMNQRVDPIDEIMFHVVYAS